MAEQFSVELELARRLPSICLWCNAVIKRMDYIFDGGVDHRFERKFCDRVCKMNFYHIPEIRRELYKLQFGSRLARADRIISSQPEPPSPALAEAAYNATAKAIRKSKRAKRAGKQGDQEEGDTDE